MDGFDGRIAIITGGGDGMGRELAVQLAAEGAHVALCDLSEENMAETLRRCREAAPAGAGRRYVSARCDVADEASLEAFRDLLLAELGTDHAHLLFNNAGIGGGGSFLKSSRAEWERTFDVCWRGVYLGCRVLLPLLVRADAGHVVNTSSVNGFWGSLGPSRAHTAYVAAKFAVKGFTEALITDLRLNAPHVRASVVMPGHIGTGIALNSVVALGGEVDATATERGAAFRNLAPTTAASAATTILEGVRAGRWRILVGEDAHVLDQLVREDPEAAYEDDFVRRMHQLGVFQAIVAPPA
ncbi:MAG: SDR family NAD(P)-dependent oxidoreductase [Acidimicrobiales bacterium]|nr:SDR family NAD(P)-dependent oxidoreductase [Acidimicrobiales bacterium]